MNLFHFMPLRSHVVVLLEAVGVFLYSVTRGHCVLMDAPPYQRCFATGCQASWDSDKCSIPPGSARILSGIYGGTYFRNTTVERFTVDAAAATAGSIPRRWLSPRARPEVEGEGEGEDAASGWRQGASHPARVAFAPTLRFDGPLSLPLTFLFLPPPPPHSHAHISRLGRGHAVSLVGARPGHGPTFYDPGCIRCLRTPPPPARGLRSPGRGDGSTGSAKARARSWRRAAARALPWCSERRKASGR